MVMAVQYYDYVAPLRTHACLPRRHKGKDKETKAIRQFFQTNYDNFRKELFHEIKVLNSRLYSKCLITDTTKMKEDIDSTLTVISSRLQNDDVAMSTFVGFCEAVYSISNCKHLLKSILSPGMRFKLGLTKELLALSASSDEELLEEAPDQNENSIGGMASSNSMSDTEKLEELQREKDFWQRLAYEKTSENIQINKQLKEALGSLQSKDNTVKDLRKEVQCLKAKLVFRTQRMKRVGNKPRLAEQNTRQAERVSLKKIRFPVKARWEYNEEETQRQSLSLPEVSLRQKQSLQEQCRIFHPSRQTLSLQGLSPSQTQQRLYPRQTHEQTLSLGLKPKEDTVTAPEVVIAEEGAWESIWGQMLFKAQGRHFHCKD